MALALSPGISPVPEAFGNLLSGIGAGEADILQHVIVEACQMPALPRQLAMVLVPVGEADEDRQQPGSRLAGRLVSRALVVALIWWWLAKPERLEPLASEG